MRLSTGSQGSGSARATVGGRVGMTLFGVFFGTIGLGIMLAALRDVRAERATREWAPTPATIEQAQVVDDGEGYRLNLAYRDADGEAAYTGTRLRVKGGDTFDEVAKGQSLLAASAASSMRRSASAINGNPLV